MGRSGRWGGYGALVLVGLLLALVQVWTRLQVVEVGYALSSTRQLLHSLHGERQALEVEWSAQTSAGRLAVQAKQRLKMEAPRPEQVFHMP
jgi:cell division protein FtsL